MLKLSRERDPAPTQPHQTIEMAPLLRQVALSSEAAGMAGLAAAPTALPDVVAAAASCRLSDVPLSAMEEILKKLPPQDAMRLAGVNRAFRTAAKNPVVWLEQARKEKVLHLMTPRQLQELARGPRWSCLAKGAMAGSLLGGATASWLFVVGRHLLNLANDYSMYSQKRENYSALGTFVVIMAGVAALPSTFIGAFVGAALGDSIDARQQRRESRQQSATARTLQTGQFSFELLEKFHSDPTHRNNANLQAALRSLQAITVCGGRRLHVENETFRKAVGRHDWAALQRLFAADAPAGPLTDLIDQAALSRLVSRAVKKRQPAIVRALLRRGVEVTAKDVDELSAQLNDALNESNSEQVENLVACGARCTTPQARKSLADLVRLPFLSLDEIPLAIAHLLEGFYEAIDRSDIDFIAVFPSERFLEHAGNQITQALQGKLQVAYEQAVLQGAWLLAEALSKHPMGDLDASAQHRLTAVLATQLRAALASDNIPLAQTLIGLDASPVLVDNSGRSARKMFHALLRQALETGNLDRLEDLLECTIEVTGGSAHQWPWAEAVQKPIRPRTLTALLNVLDDAIDRRDYSLLEALYSQGLGLSLRYTNGVSAGIRLLQQCAEACHASDWPLVRTLQRCGALDRRENDGDDLQTLCDELRSALHDARQTHDLGTAASLQVIVDSL